MQCTEASDSVAWPLSYLYVHFTRGYLPGTAVGQKIWGATLQSTNIQKRPKKFEKKILPFVLTLQSNRCLMGFVQLGQSVSIDLFMSFSTIFWDENYVNKLLIGPKQVFFLS